MGDPGPADVLVIGESIMDLIEADGVILQSPGGSAANVALGLGRLGMAVEFLTSIGNDDYGRTLISNLYESGVKVAPESMNAPRTSTATAILNSSGRAAYEFDVVWDITPPRLEPAPRLLHVGSIAAFSRPASAIVRNAISRMTGHEITFDPNIRPALMTGTRDEEVEEFEATASLTTVVKLSDDDADWLYPELTVAEVAHRIVSLGPNLGVVTLGGEGSLIAGKTFEISVPAVPPADVVDTIGAGDTYMAAMIWFLLRNESDSITSFEARVMGEFCSGAASVTVGRRGADLPHLSELTLPVGG